MRNQVIFYPSILVFLFAQPDNSHRKIRIPEKEALYSRKGTQPHKQFQKNSSDVCLPFVFHNNPFESPSLFLIWCGKRTIFRNNSSIKGAWLHPIVHLDFGILILSVSYFLPPIMLTAKNITVRRIPSDGGLGICSLFPWYIWQ